MEIEYEGYHKPAIEPIAKTYPTHYEPVHVHSHHKWANQQMYIQKVQPAAVAPSYGFGSTTAAILVLFILLVIISRAQGLAF